MKPMKRLGSMVVVATAAVLAWRGRADAQQAQTGKLDADAYRRDVATEIHETPPGKAGAFMLNAKAGPSIGMTGSSLNAAMTADLGYAFVKGNHRNAGQGDLYGVVSPTVQVGSNAALSLPIGLQYDIPLPVSDLYVYPRATLGYAGVATSSPGLPSGNYLEVMPAAGLRYVPDARYNVGFEPVAVPMYIGASRTAAHYRMLAWAGTNF